MNTRVFIVGGTLLVLLAGLLLLSGCNTWHGAGQDLQHAGEKMQNQ